LYAIKVCFKKGMKAQDRLDLDKEVRILRMMNHKNIIRIYGYYQDRLSFYVVMELMHGGHVLDRIEKRKSYTEKDARDACKQIFEAVAYCHSNKVVHRDIKPDNMLLMSLNNDTEIKLADFGFATFASSEDSLKTQCGTPHYVAPEILLEKNYGK